MVPTLNILSRKTEIMHPAHIVHFPLPFALGDYLAQVGQRNVSAELLDKLLLTVLPCPPAFVASKPYYLARIIA
jgi:hypothetical protein